MLSIGKLGVANGADYCLAKVANSVDDYYLVPRRGSGSGDREIRRTIGTGRNRRSGAVRNLLTGLSARASPSICNSDRGGSRLRPHVLCSQRCLAPLGVGVGGRGGRRLGRTRPGRGSCPRPPVIRGLLRSARTRWSLRGHGNHRRRLPPSHQQGRRPPPPHPSSGPNLVRCTDVKWPAPDGRHLYIWKMSGDQGRTQKAVPTPSPVPDQRTAIQRRSNLQAARTGNPEMAASWVGSLGPAPRLNPVTLEPMKGPMQAPRRRMTQATRPFAMRSAGTEKSSTSIVPHVGRRSGRIYETPVIAVEHEHGFLINRPCADRANWGKNVVTSGEGDSCDPRRRRSEGRRGRECNSDPNPAIRSAARLESLSPSR